MLSKRKRVSFSAKQKREIFYNYRYLRESDRWLTITESQENIKKFRRPKWPQLEDALGLWVDNTLNTKQNIDGNILKFKKQGEAESALLAESIERDRLALQQLLVLYNPEDIWNSDETGLFWKMEPSRVLACNSLSGHKKEKSCITIFCATNATGNETQEKLDSIDNRIDVYDDVQDGIVKELADYTIYNALQNATEAWSMVSPQTISNCWKKTGILLPSINETEEIPDDDSVFSDDSFDMDIDKLEALIFQLPKSDLSAYEYLHIEDEMPEEGLTDFEIVDTIQNANKEKEDMSDEIEFTPTLEKVSPTDAEKAIDKTMKFLYEQGPEFGDVNKELKVLRKLHKKVKF
ncbi:tigger transposable element-derived protein 6-like [Rhizophagus clarus]|uniref:Tigger transposable element-derived protein 6-like n=1 Tax=Rhizophagus clarus TaxID=94130 RepID=A0A8H3QV42_9GLOM|nr:tigger transposable element-derived protein 6-like [Rhizophagus clarus]